jgi:hypothetical protein
VSWQVHVRLFGLGSSYPICTIHGHAGHALNIVIVKNVCAFIIVLSTAASGSGQAAEVTIKNALVIAGVDSGG